MKFKLIQTFLLFMLIGLTANAQFLILVDGRLPKYFTHYEVGYSYSFTTINQTQTFTLSDGSVHTFKQTGINSLMSPGVYVGWSTVLKRMGMNKSTGLGLHFGVQENMAVWSHTSKSWGTVDNGENGFYDEETVGMSLQLGVPVSLDLKFGFDANKYKNIRWGGSLGVGVMPQVTFSAGIPNFESESVAAGFTPFIKGDIGFFAGIAFKLRAQVGLGFMPIADSEHSLFGGISGGLGGDESVQHDYKVNAPMQTTISLIIMPFSWGWEERGWWNTRR